MDANARTAANIAENDARRHNGNVLVNPPCRHIGQGRFQNAQLDGRGGYFYPAATARTGDFTVPGW